MFFKALRAEIVETDLDLALDVVIGGAGDQNAARFGDGLQAGRDVDTVAIEIAALDHHVAQVDADAQNDVAILGLITIGGGHGLLQIDGALHGIDGTAELHQHAVPGDFEDAALVPGDQRVQYILAPRS